MAKPFHAGHRPLHRLSGICPARPDLIREKLFRLDIYSQLHKILEEYRAECDGAQTGPLFDMELEKLAQRTVKRIVEGTGLTWHGAHALRRGIATNLYSLGASDKIVQRIVGHAKRP